MDITTPVPKYTVPPVFGQPQEMVVDIICRVNNQDVNYQKVSASAEIADCASGGVVISTNREAMNAEIVSLKGKSIETINSIDYHKGVVESCNKMLEDLNPEFAERQAQQNDINTLKSQMQELMDMNKTLLAKLGHGSAVNE